MPRTLPKTIHNKDYKTSDSSRETVRSRMKKIRKPRNFRTYRQFGGIFEIDIIKDRVETHTYGFMLKGNSYLNLAQIKKLHSWLTKYIAWRESK